MILPCSAAPSHTHGFQTGVCVCAAPDSLLQVEIYRDEDKARQEDIASLKVTDEAFASFYERVKDLREYHKKHSTYDVTEVGIC